MKQEDDLWNITDSSNESAIEIEVVPDVYLVQDTKQQSHDSIPSIQRPLSNAERQKRYRDKKKEKRIAKINACSTISQSNDDQKQREQEREENDVQINKPRDRTNAERQRRYRRLLREKQKQQTDVNTIRVQDVDPDKYARKRYLNQQRQSRYRARQRFEWSTSTHRTEADRMSKEDKEQTGFGFKDRAKAEETLKLLESHDLNYRRLIVRGLLGRAKRVLSLTKAEDKIKNIKEAMEVFEGWLAELEKNKEKPEKKKEERKRKRSENKESSSDVEMEDKNKEKKELPAETVPGLGFKDKEAVENTLKQLEGRDPDYQQLAIKALIRSAKRVLTCTRDETKLANIKESISIFEKFLDDFDTQHMSRQNNPYVSLGIVNACVLLAGDILTDEQYADAKLFNDKGEPTPEHLAMLLWAYSPEPARLRSLSTLTDDHQPPAHKRQAH